nr:hypothetical protein GCM10025732_42480 [Glycomyces mayteni]
MADRPYEAELPVVIEQPYQYRRRELVEPDWTRFPGWTDVTEADWASAQWQRVHCVKNVKQLRALMGDRLHESFYEDLESDIAHSATMSMLLPPQMLNTMVPGSRRPRRARGRTRSTPTRCAGTCCRWPRTGTRTGPPTPSRRATRCTSTTCGPSRA